MLYQSTRGDKHLVNSKEAVLKGIADDGGLYMPANLDFSKFDWQKLMGLAAKEIAAKILSFFLDDFPDPREIIYRAYDHKFDTEELTPLVKLGDRYVLELFHGPTSAFKDVALSVLPQLMLEAKEATKDKIVILTATSGDTGKAALEGFHDIDGIEIIVFYPESGVSDVQKMQMITQKGRNVHSVAVRGNFDDCQTAVKKIFDEAAKSHILAHSHAMLTSANSINIGRLVPQIVYYFEAYNELLKHHEINLGDKIDFTVPTGNFGDIFAGYLAKKLGLPVGTLIIASNQNKILTDFVKTGIYDKRREFYKTLSPSMDILVSSNLERLLYMESNNDANFVKEMMHELLVDAHYQIPKEILLKIQSEFKAGFASDEESKLAIKAVWEKHHYLMDTHTAVAWKVASELKSERPNVVLATASPYKFPDAVSDALGISHNKEEFETMDNLSKITGTAEPFNLSHLKEQAVRFTEVIEKEDMLNYVISLVDRM